MSTNTLNVYHIDDGADYYVAATNVSEALKLYQDNDPSMAEDQSLEYGITIKRLQKDAAANISIRDDEDSTQSPRSAADLASSGEPRIIGCSEW